MANMKYTIHRECAKHNVSSLFVEVLIARILVSRAIFRQYMRTKVAISNTSVLAGSSLPILDADLFLAALDVGCNITLTKEIVQNYVVQYIRVYKQEQRHQRVRF